jgi:hypothetical protein
MCDLPLVHFSDRAAKPGRGPRVEIVGASTFSAHLADPTRHPSIPRVCPALPKQGAIDRNHAENNNVILIQRHTFLCQSRETKQLSTFLMKRPSILHRFAGPNRHPTLPGVCTEKPREAAGLHSVPAAASCGNTGLGNGPPVSRLYWHAKTGGATSALPHARWKPCSYFMGSTFCCEPSPFRSVRAGRKTYCL